MNVVVETCRRRSIYATTYYKWKEKYNEGGETALLPGVIPNGKENI